MDPLLDCREIDDYCVECDAPNHCTKCALSPFESATADGDFSNQFLQEMDTSTDGTACATPTPFCRDSFDDQYEDLDADGVKDCTACLEPGELDASGNAYDGQGYRWSSVDYQCTPCNSPDNYGDFCINCGSADDETDDVCDECEAGYHVIFDGSGCKLDYENCKTPSTSYSTGTQPSGATEFLCDECKEGFYWDTTLWQCASCKDLHIECIACSENVNGNVDCTQCSGGWMPEFTQNEECGDDCCTKKF